MSQADFLAGIPADLVNEIFTARLRLRGSLRASLPHALELGDLLLEAKRQCRHGEWLSWLKDSFEGRVREAQRYMQLATEFPPESRKDARVQELTLTEALEIIAAKNRRSKGQTFTNESISQSTLEATYEDLRNIGTLVKHVLEQLALEGLTDKHEAMKQAKKIRAVVSHFRNYVVEQLEPKDDTAASPNLDEALAMLELVWPCGIEDVEAAYRSKAKKCHPDAGGTQEQFVALQRAYEEVKAACEAAVAQGT